MAFTNQSPLIPLQPQNNQAQMQQKPFTPQEWEYIQQVRQTGYDPSKMPQFPQQQAQQVSDPYVDFENEFSGCSVAVKNRILNDETFKTVMAECDSQIQRMVETLVRPQVMQTKDGRLCFEKLLATFRDLNSKYANEESQNLERLQMIMQDDVVRKRIMEIEKESKGAVNNGK